MTLIYVVLVLVGVFPTIISGQNLSIIVDCPTFTPTPIIGNPIALEMLREWCAADPRCAEQYGQSIAPNQALFNTLFQSTTHSYSGTLYLESPLIEDTCNKTFEYVNREQWVRSMRLDILERGRACHEGETNDIVDDSGDIICSDLPWNQCTDVNGFNTLGLAIEIAIFVVVLIAITTQIWTFIRRRKPQTL